MSDTWEGCIKYNKICLYSYSCGYTIKPCMRHIILDVSIKDDVTVVIAHNSLEIIVYEFNNKLWKDEYFL